MKLITRILSLLVLAGLTAFYVSCKPDDPEKSVEQQQHEKIIGSWNLTLADDGTVRTADFPGLVLTLSGQFVEGTTYNYILTGTRPNPSPWPADGTWKFGTNPSTDIIRDPTVQGSSGNGEIPVFYSVTDNVLTLKFNIPDGHTGWSGSRTESVTGDWIFEFERAQ